MALAGPPKEKPHPVSAYNAGTVEPMGVSPPEAVAYQVLVTLHLCKNQCQGFFPLCQGLKFDWLITANSNFKAIRYDLSSASH